MSLISCGNFEVDTLLNSSLPGERQTKSPHSETDYARLRERVFAMDQVGGPVGPTAFAARVAFPQLEAIAVGLIATRHTFGKIVKITTVAYGFKIHTLEPQRVSIL